MLADGGEPLGRDRADPDHDGAPTLGGVPIVTNRFMPRHHIRLESATERVTLDLETGEITVFRLAERDLIHGRRP